MSRSRKKAAVFKDPSNTKGKAIANRKLRRKVKETLHHESEAMPLLDEVMNYYDLVDFKTFGDKKRDPDSYEKLKRK